ncbi:MAG: DNA translocase FtsK 4TM domain-containing protein [Bacillota bacterium]
MSKFFSQLAEDLRWELGGLGFLALGVLGLLGFFTGATGAVGRYLVRACRILLGDAGLIIPIVAVLTGIALMARRREFSLSTRHAGWTLLTLALASFLHLRIPAEELANGWRGLGGGVTGAAITLALGKWFGPAGRLTVLVTSVMVGIILAANASLVELGRSGWRRLRAGWALLVEAVMDFFYVRHEEPAQAPAPPPGRTRHTPRRTATPVRDEAPALPREPQEPAVPGPPEQLTFDPELGYQLPPLSLLEKGVSRRSVRSDRDASDKARLLEETLQSFGVGARVVDVTRGPAVTRFEVQPAPGVKVASIVSLANDIALKLACSDLRIEAPIPGKSALGIEVPNQEISIVHLREVLESPEYTSAASKITVALGKDIAGRSIVDNLERMPHLLIAGATGSGKSVCINGIIASLLYKARPDEVKLLMIDPKMVELSQYQGIPHLLAPVVTDPKKAAGALRWVLREMDHRYELFVPAGVRDIARYNQVKASGASPGIPPALPYIVVIIDELADLMVVAPVEVEDSVFRLAQMARAAGIHLVVATQRPSVDVITGTIKANIPSRIAFAVSSSVDSRTILDMAGAERLVGRGDMLYAPVGATKPVRAQGAYISEQEVEELVRFVCRQGKPHYASGVMEAVATAETQSSSESDELFPQALQIVVEAGQASVSLLQRKLPIGYTRAGRLIDAMEERGFVGPYEGSKPREVRLSILEFDRLFGKKASGETSKSGGADTAEA